MPTRARLFATRASAALLLVAAVAVIVLFVGQRDAQAMQTAGYALPSLIAAGLFAAAAFLATPTVLFSLRRRRYKRILAAEG